MNYDQLLSFDVAKLNSIWKNWWRR